MSYNTQALRDLLCAAFNDEELYTFCYDNFLEVSKNFTTGQSQTTRAQMLMEYCDRKGTLDKLLHLVRKRNPLKYAEFALRLTTRVLDKRLDETLQLYLSKSFKDDQYARLDQAGETDPDRTTLLRQIFVDLEVKPRSGQQPRRSRRGQATLFEEPKRIAEELRIPGEGKALSAMDCFLRERWPTIVVIGGPGQGKSTLGQYLAQVHRTTLLEREKKLKRRSHGSSKAKEQEFIPEIPRVPFRIILKYFAQWLADRPRVDSVEAYLAEQIERDTSRRMSPEEVQNILRACPSLMIFDGLDEVIEPDLRGRLLARVEEFLERAEQLEANPQVLATSRPTGYSDQFDPQQFWHFELQPMSVEKVRDYAKKWVQAKVPVQEEQRRVLGTLEECLQEEHTRLLLTTPLQVTIILLIIKDGGRPPAQREALFHEYWGTIFRREKAKAKGIIRTEEPLLFDLHTYLGYLLQRRAASENVRSLLPTDEFEKAVHNFLCEKDSRSPEDVIRQRAAQMVKEARDRLVLLVEPVPGLFGFELRSLQEFFAAAYLAQTARDTSQRFDRLKAIARSEHWRNVALFFAGRIVRNFGGEAEKILVDVCLPIDRDPIDRYLRSGAWLTLDIAADGAFAANRNLQYLALEHALTVLETGVTSRNEEHLKTALRRLSPEDHRDILGPLLEQKLASLPLSCLATGLDAYGRFVSTHRDFLQGLEALLSSNRPEYVRSALDLGFLYQAEPRWLAAQLEQHWSAWAEKDGGHTLWNWWQKAPQYIEAVLSAWSPSEGCTHHLLSKLLSTHWYVGPGPDSPSFKLTDEPRSLADQMIATLQCLSILSMLTEPGPREPTDHIEVQGADGVRLFDVDKARERRASLVACLKVSSTQLDQLLARLDLVPHLRASLWGLYWLIHEPTEAGVSAFLEEVQDWAKDSMVPEAFWSFWLERSWPLLAFAVKRRVKGDQEAMKRLQPYLSGSQETAINRQVRAAMRALAQRASSEEWTEFVLNLRFGEVSSLPELTSLADGLEITVAELVLIYLSYWVGRDEHRYSSAEIRHVFSAMGKALTQSQDIWYRFWFVANAKWSLDKETLAQGKQLLIALMDRLSQLPDTILVVVVLFFKLLAVDQTMLSLALPLLTVMGNLREVRLEMPPWWIVQSIVAVPLKRLAKLAEFTRHEDKTIRQGALALWEVSIDAVLAESHYRSKLDARKWERVRSLRFDWQLGLSLISDADNISRRRGIALLTLSDFPATDAVRRTELLSAMAKAQGEDEVEAWARLLRAIPVPESREKAWRELLESILTQPRTYSSTILTAAMERYATLVGEAGPHIMGDEAALGLPTIGR